MMGVQSGQQMVIFGQSILMGVAVGMLYDLLRPLRQRLPRLTSLADTVYCLAIGAASIRFLLGQAEGELRGFILLGIVGGAVLFFCTGSLWLRPVWEFWADTLGYLAYLLSFPLVWAKKLVKKICKYGKNVFYFTRKYYTIKKTGCFRASRRGGGKHEKKTK